jgi:tRNA threonylcarbamoyladenosine biosynthesis protein TsaB
MHVLALDTTTREGSIAIVDGERVLFERCGDGSRSHGERLPDEVIRALAASGLTSADVDLFAVASGPGSFTGLRIGIATIQGLALVHRKRVVPVSALRAMAHAASTTLPEGSLVGAWMDAHRRDVFSAIYRVEHAEPFALGRLKRLDGPTVASPVDTLSRWAAARLQPVCVVGDGAMKYVEELAEVAPAQPAPLLASVVARIAAACHPGCSVDPAGVQPLYVRRPDAELARDASRRQVP